jgi:hypothetical protein
MTISEINRRFAKLDKLDSALTDEFIAVGRGHETYQQILRQTDPLALRLRTLYEQRMELVAECQRQWGMNRPPLSRRITIR